MWISFYDLNTRDFTGQRAFVSVMSAEVIERLTPEGCGVIAGEHDHLSRRVLIEAGRVSVIDFIPEQPADDDMQTFAWHEADRRWKPTPTLKALRKAAADTVDGNAGATRLRFITDAPGQAAIYAEKASQAHAYALAGYAGDVPPYIAAEIAATGRTGQQVADGIIAADDLWMNTTAPAIEQIRLSAKAQIANAEAPALDSIVTAAIVALNGV